MPDRSLSSSSTPDDRSKSGDWDRRRFLAAGAAIGSGALFGPASVGPELNAAEAEVAPGLAGQTPPTPELQSDDLQAGITQESVAAAERLAAIALDDDERNQVIPVLERAARQYRGRRKVDFPNSLSPVLTFRVSSPLLPAEPSQRVDPESLPLPSDEQDIAFAPVTALSRWIASGRLTSERLTRIYLDRLERIGPQLECVITLTGELALAQAKQMDRETRSGKNRGPLHGIPYGAKDLFDTKGILTTYGAAPYRNRVATRDAKVVERLREAGAVLIAKTTLGALAYGDIWFGGRTRSPWKPSRGSSGSSAGSAAATAAGLLGFSIGTETLGSIVSPSMRCGTAGLRPTFGRVSRAGAMALCWSLDKVGPICRTVEDTAWVLAAMAGPDPEDASSVDAPFGFDANRSIRGLRVGYDPRWFEGRRARDLDRKALDHARALGLELVEVDFPDWPYSFLTTILNVEAATAFEELTLSNRDDELDWQSPQAWPNSFRAARFVPAIECLQADRFRRRVVELLDEKFKNVDVMLGPSYAGAMLLTTNFTGHPSITFRTGFAKDGQPHGMTAWGKHFEEATICRVASALERKFDAWHQRP